MADASSVPKHGCSAVAGSYRWSRHGFPPGAHRDREEGSALAAQDRLTIEQLVALSPGDVVVVEVSGDSRRPRRISGTVVRVEGSQIDLSERSARGVAYVNRYSRRDGLRLGRGSTAQLINGTADGPVTSEKRQHSQLVERHHNAGS